MSARQKLEAECRPEEGRCLTRSVVEALSQEPGLEAVTLDRARHTISVATLGKADVAQLTARLSAKLLEAGEAPAAPHCELLEGRDACLTCERPLSDTERKKITIQHGADTTTIARVTCPTAPRFWRWRDFPLPKVVPREHEFFEHPEEMDEWKAQLLAAGLCGAFGLCAWFCRSYPWSPLVYLAAYVAGGWDAAKDVWERLRERAIDVHFLMLAVAAGSASIGAWAEGATLLFLFSLSGALEHLALERTQREIRSLFREAPKTATIVDAEGREREMPVEKLRPGLRLLIKPGAQFPVDAEVIKGRTASDESNLTGEAVPVEKSAGDIVLGGTLNLWGAVEAVVLRGVAESSMQKIIRLIKEAQRHKAPAQQFTDRFSAYYTWTVLLLAGVMFCVWWLVLGQPAFAGGATGRGAFYHAMTLLVVSSPCALVLSIPSAVLAAIAWGARHGILFRGGAAVEKLAAIDTVALDKTGTLTTGELRVESVESFPPGREAEVLQLAYSLEKLSTHPLARAIVKHGRQLGMQPCELTGFESFAGCGLRAQRQGRECRLGRRDWLAEGHLASRIQAIAPTPSGFSEIWLVEGELLGRIVLRDDIRAQARHVLEELHAAGLRTVVLTGDRRAAAEPLRTELRVEVMAELKPEDKVKHIEALTRQGRLVGMVGDGVNDAPSLAAAHIGVAMGTRGADAALEQADVVLMHDRLENFFAAFRLSQRARRIIRQNLVVSLGTVIVLVSFALLRRIPLTVGVVGHEGSTVLVVMNSLRLLFGAARSSKPRAAL